MTNDIDRRTAIALTAGAALSATTAQAAADGKATGLVERQPQMSAILPNTHYFEIDSARAGARYAIWVTTPSGYDRDPSIRFPVVYQPDGNWAAPRTVPDLQYLPSDAINPIVPFIQVCVGYAGDDVRNILAVRARDLLPPGEPVPDGLEAGLRQEVEQGLYDRDGAELYLRNLRNPAADKFLVFLTDELHPLLAKKFRFKDERAGLFGYSYGGLFAAYAALQRSSLFYKIGAGSPGIQAQHSKIFDLYASEVKAAADHTGRSLHITLNEREITVASYYQPFVSAGTTAFIAMASQAPLRGLAISSRIMPEESHVSGQAASWYSYLRTFYSARG
ncbi:alpha/beta hydrolase [Caulobacter soli]|uniref:alpha/beta hydrolase n=1 Tax=Caulobacter soli TaxID=2708539 RepID=UPI0013EA987C|nr:alpha/beta hydrolase-fold protein [Caulobacter soli]